MRSQYGVQTSAHSATPYPHSIMQPGISLALSARAIVAIHWLLDHREFLQQPIYSFDCERALPLCYCECDEQGTLRRTPANRTVHRQLFWAGPAGAALSDIVDDTVFAGAFSKLVQ